MTTGLPDPAITPLLTVAGLIECGVLPHRKSAIYDAVERGEIPSIRVGARLMIPVAELRRRWLIDPPLAEGSGDAA